MKRIEYIDNQGLAFRLKILGVDCVLIKASMYVGNDLFPKPAVVKGSTLGWNFSNEFVSYNQIKQEIRKK